MASQPSEALTGQASHWLRQRVYEANPFAIDLHAHRTIGECVLRYDDDLTATGANGDGVVNGIVKRTCPIRLPRAITSPPVTLVRISMRVLLVQFVHGDDSSLDEQVMKVCERDYR